MGADWRQAGCPQGVLVAAVLTVEGVGCLLVGSAALWLRGEPVGVGDADLVIEPGEGNLSRLRLALTGMALRPGLVPPVQRLRWLPVVTVRTSYGMVDCLLERGCAEWDQLRGRAEVLAVADAGVLTAAAADARALAGRFKA
jgi:hypothetical protein